MTQLRQGQSPGRREGGDVGQQQPVAEATLAVQSVQRVHHEAFIKLCKSGHLTLDEKGSDINSPTSDVHRMLMSTISSPTTKKRKENTKATEKGKKQKASVKSGAGGHGCAPPSPWPVRVAALWSSQTARGSRRPTAG